MAIGTITINKHEPEMGLIDISFPGDGAYAAGGTENFEASVEAAIKAAAAAAVDKNVRGERNIEILNVMQRDCGDFVPLFVPGTTDKLKVYKRSDGAEASGNLSGTTFNLTVVYR